MSIDTGNKRQRHDKQGKKGMEKNGCTHIEQTGLRPCHAQQELELSHVV